jgi:hypothetical protein
VLGGHNVDGFEKVIVDWVDEEPMDKLILVRIVCL